MYCKNCGSEMNPAAAVCVKCGAARGTGAGFCQNCGQPVAAGAAVCLSCGSALAPSINTEQQKSKLAAGLLGIFLGGFGVHNFYLGYTGKAVAQILLSFCCGIGAVWGFIEGILILTGRINMDAKGIPLRE